MDLTEISSQVNGSLVHSTQKDKLDTVCTSSMTKYYSLQATSTETQISCVWHSDITSSINFVEGKNSILCFLSLHRWIRIKTILQRKYLKHTFASTHLAWTTPQNISKWLLLASGIAPKASCLDTFGIHMLQLANLVLLASGMPLKSVIYLYIYLNSTCYKPTTCQL